MLVQKVYRVKCQRFDCDWEDILTHKWTIEYTIEQHEVYVHGGVEEPDHDVVHEERDENIFQIRCKCGIAWGSHALDFGGEDVVLVG